MEENKNTEIQEPEVKQKNTKKILLISAICLLVIVGVVVALLLLGGSNECKHNWGEYSVVTDATCTAEGVKERKCSECGKTETAAIEMLAHTYNQEIAKNETLKSNATCTSAEVYYKSCACGAVSTNDADTFTSGEALGHTYTLQSTTEATCEEPAKNIYVCACGDTYSDNLSDKLGHVINPSTATEKHVGGCEYVLVYTCGRCQGEVAGESAFYHEYSASIKTEATCKEAGVKLLTCACGHTKEEEIPKNEAGHVWVKGDVAEGERIDTCSVCGGTKSVVVYEGTSTNQTNASDLADKEIEINDTNISLDSGVIDSIGDKDIVISAGKIEGADKETLGLSAEQLAQTGNSPIYDFSITDGNGFISNFGKDNFVTITLPYTLEDGEDVDNIAIWFINDNGQLEAIEAVYSNGYVTFKTNHFSYYTVTRLNPTERCALYGHSYVTHTQVGNCTTDGYDTLVCVRCHDKKIENFVAAPGHKYVVETKDATCTEAGYVNHVCSTCGNKYGTKIPAIGHAYGNPTWTWSDDCSSATLTLTCSNDATHIVELTPTVDLTVVSLICCDYVKSHGVVSRIYNGVLYSDEKIVEKGTIDHKFASELTYDDDAHWYACVCGEKKDVTTHTFENETVTKAPNCKDTGEKTYSCTCGATKVVTLPVTNDHNFVNGSCTVCGVSGEACDHEELQTVTLNCADYGCCAGEFSYESCRCGKVKILDPYSMGEGTTCNIQTEMEDEFENEDGSYGAKMVGLCSVCGLRYIVDAVAVDEGCVTYVDYTMTFELNGVILVENLTYSYDDVYHRDLAREEIDLTEFGVCGGSLLVYKCADCGDIELIDDYKDVTCTSGEPVISETTDENGLVHKITKTTCSVCGLEHTVDVAIDEVSVCESTTYVKVTVSRGDVVIAEYEDTTSKNSHQYTYEYKLLGKTCEEGVEVTRHCQLCDYTYKYTQYYCNSNGSETIYLDKQGACNGGTISVYQCPTCKKITNISGTNLTCEFANDVIRELKDDNGNLIGYEVTSTCTDCGITIVESDWFDDIDVCKYETKHSFCIYKGTECLLEFTKTVETQTNHDVEYTYEPYGDSCEDGYKIIATCKKCGTTSTSSAGGHKEESFTIDLSEYNACGGTVTAYRCTICNKISRISSFSISCSWYMIYGNFGITPTPEVITDENGVVHQITKKTCEDCGLTYCSDTWYEKSEECEETRHTRMYFSMDEEIIVEYTDSSIYTEHNYIEVQKPVVPNGNMCEDGYYRISYCSDCGYVYINHYNGYGHEFHYSATITDTESGICGGFDRIGRVCYICGLVVYDEFKESGMCVWQYVGPHPDGYDVYRCNECGAERHEYNSTSDKDENCYVTVENVVIYYMNGEELFRYDNSGIYQNHKYGETIYELLGDSCDDGYLEILTCTDCGYTHSYTSSGHRTTEVEWNYDCCDNQHFTLETCLCGENVNMWVSDYSCEQTKEDGIMTYTWSCGLVLTYTEQTVHNGCSYSEKYGYIVTLNGEEVYRKEVNNESITHNFGSVISVVENGKRYLVAACSGCGEVMRHEVIEITVNKEDGENYFYYYFTPETSATYSYRNLNTSYAYEYIYMVIGDRMIRKEWLGDQYSGYGYEKTINLKAGITYALRFEAYQYFDNQKFSFIFAPKNSLVEPNHSHYYYYAPSTLLGGATSCEDGVLNVSICKYCSAIGSYSISYSHNKKYTEVSFAELGACYGYMYYYSCPCGEIKYEDLGYHSCGTYTYNEQYDSEGRLVYTETTSCAECGLRIGRSYYYVSDYENCRIIYYYTVIIKIGDKLIVNTEYTSEKDEHDYVITGELLGGEGTTCKEGVTLTYTCKQCDYTYSYTDYYHMTFEKERIDLAELGSVCGGYATLTGCLCGSNNYLSFNHALCEFGRRWCEMWIEDALTGYHFNFRNDTYFSYDAYIYVCSVTDPEEAACSYMIRCASYWKKAEDECRAYRYYTYQFGYNEETGTCEYELTFKTDESIVYHNYTVTETDNGKKYDCDDCGTSYYDYYYYDDDGNLIKREVKLENMLDDGEIKYYEYIEEYAMNADGERYRSREYLKTVESNGYEYWSEELYYEESYVGPFGDPGRKLSISRKTSYGTEDSSSEYAYVYYNGYDYYIYRYETYSDYWEKFDYTYSFTDGCVKTITYSSSNGDNWTESENCCRYHHYNMIKEPTCTQSGLYGYTCVICGSIGESYEESPNDHSWVWVDSDWYYCYTCGLENANSMSGEVVMEDLTDKYGNGENYVIGYWARKDIEFSYYVSLILTDGSEIIVDGVKFFDVDGVRAIAFNKEDVDTWAADNGYTDYVVRFSFVPYGADGSFDYGITFTETVEHSVITGKTAFSVYVGAGEVKEYVISTPDSYAWTFTSISNGDTYAELYSEDGHLICSNDDYDDWNFKIYYDSKGGETYILKVQWLDSEYEGEMRLIFNCR